MITIKLKKILIVIVASLNLIACSAELQESQSASIDQTSSIKEIDSSDTYAETDDSFQPATNPVSVTGSFLSASGIRCNNIIFTNGTFVCELEFKDRNGRVYVASTLPAELRPLATSAAQSLHDFELISLFGGRFYTQTPDILISYPNLTVTTELPEDFEYTDYNYIIQAKNRAENNQINSNEFKIKAIPGSK